jgi:hypothetical protein
MQTSELLLEIEDAIQRLSPEELRAFRRWFAKYDAQQWDAEFERDVAEGRLDALAEEAVREYNAGRCRDLSWRE